MADGLIGGDAGEFVLGSHIGIFERAARQFAAYILVRKTGAASLRWVGREGYTGKRADMKAKTAKRDLPNYKLAGLVCSPLLHPGAFTDLAGATDFWNKCSHLITVPTSRGGIDESLARRCRTPYLLQTNPHHPHFGCIAWVECGIVAPRYVHGDYDLYAIVSAKDKNKKTVHTGNLASTMSVAHLSLEKQLAHQASVPNFYSPLQFQIMNWLDAEFGYPMVMHGEQENVGFQDEAVLVFLPEPKLGKSHLILSNGQEIKNFYSRELNGRTL